MPWRIDYDHLDNVPSAVTSRDYDAAKDAELTLRFRLYDDDGNLCYSGRMHPDDDDEEAAFAPLDSYGTPNAGCTYMTLLEGGKWNHL